jgi:HAD superfamily hydrolase (TIGR01458 family)
VSAIRGVLLDLDGTLTDGVGGPALPGAIEAVRRLRARAPVRFVTNTTSRTRAFLADALSRAGFGAEADDIVNPMSVARVVLLERAHAEGILLAAPDSLPELSWFRPTAPERARSVLLATEGHDLTIGDLAPAIEALLGGARLYTLQANRLFQRDGRLVSDTGPLAAFLSYASAVPWENLGKPSPLLFGQIADALGLPLSALALCGDDAEFDASGAVAAGLGAGVLVKSGKYRPGAEALVTPPPSHLIDHIGELESVLELAG